MTVFLVGAGPGDPGLLTVRGAEVLGRADVVVYDRLSVASLLELAPPAAELVNVGKRPGVATMTQEDINDLLIARGRAGQTVVRLKGGDPFVFARGGEEARALQAAGVRYEIVPGVTSAVAVPAYAGIPLTLRHSSELFTVITGHEDPGKDGQVDWEAVARLGGTIVVLMGVGRLAAIVERLRAGGLPGDTPLTAIQWGTRPEQRTVRLSLATVVDHLDEIESPSTIVIGRVAAERLDWFEQRPLFGRRVVVTRTAAQAGELSARLRDEGAVPIEIPVIEIHEPPDGGAAMRALAGRLSSVTWVVFTSANGVDRFCGMLRDARAFGSARVAAIGPATAEALRRRNIEADLVPAEFVAEALLDAFPAPPGKGSSSVALVRALEARDVLPDGLRGAGWDVEVVPAYETRAPQVGDDVRAALQTADVVTFTSSSTVRNFVDAFGIDAVPPVVACIGPVTASTARDLGIDVGIVAEDFTTEGLVAALVRDLGAASPTQAT